MISVEERYAFATKIVNLVRDIKMKAYGSDFFGGVNWNAAVINGLTDSFEDLVFRDIFPLWGGQSSQFSDEIKREARERISALFQENRLLVAELELSGLRYGQSGPS